MNDVPNVQPPPVRRPDLPPPPGQVKPPEPTPRVNEVTPADQVRADGTRPGTDRKADAPQAAPPVRPEPDHFSKVDKPAEAAADARKILSLSEGKNPAVVLGEGVRPQLEKVAAGPEAGKPAAELTGKGKTLEIGAEQGKALSVLRTLAEKTAEHRNEPGHESDALKIVSYVRIGGGKHGEGVAFDIGAYGGHSFNEKNPAESRAAAKALVADLPPGNYGLGLPRLATKYPIPEDSQHFQKYAEDISKHAESYQRIPGGEGTELTKNFADPNSPSYAMVNFRPTEKLLKAEDPHFRQPQTPADIKLGDKARLDPGTASVVRDAAARQVFLTPFPDGFGHAHLSVVRPGAKSF